ncbi:MAG TPA: IS110 family transposase [Candidatus Binatia bacterium]|nr:IS110 family transposase [Candidatus Binatia bacterium]
MPGVSEGVAQVIVAEIGVDTTRFPSAAPLVSWAGLCPRNDASAGKRRSTRLRKGAPWLKTPIVTAAWAGVPGRPSLPSPPRCRARPTTCSTTGCRTVISAPITSRVTTRRRPSAVSSAGSAISDVRSTSSMPR